MTDKMETRKHKLTINIRHMDFILDDDDDVDGDNCNDVAHIEHDDFEAILVQIVELLFIFLVLSPSDIGLLHTIPFTPVYT